jgi:hypothetical protein
MPGPKGSSQNGGPSGKPASQLTITGQPLGVPFDRVNGNML